MEFSCWLLLISRSTWLIIVVFSQLANCYPSECVLPFPRSYVVYHLGEQESIDVDGKLDDKAWSRVSWTEDFIGDHIFYVFLIQFPKYIRGLERWYFCGERGVYECLSVSFLLGGGGGRGRGLSHSPFKQPIRQGALYSMQIPRRRYADFRAKALNPRQRSLCVAYIKCSLAYMQGSGELNKECGTVFRILAWILAQILALLLAYPFVTILYMQFCWLHCMLFKSNQPKHEFRKIGYFNTCKGTAL